MVAETTSFALRVPPAIKEAAKALTHRGIYLERSQDDGTLISGRPDTSSINAAFVFLLREGLMSAKRLVEKNIERVNSADFIPYSEIMKFFLDNPAARAAFPANFPDGSPARTLLERIEAQEADTDGEEVEGFHRSDVSMYYAMAQQEIYALTEALGAIQRALATSR